MTLLFVLLHSVVINDEAHENQVLLSCIFQPVAAAVWAEHGIPRLHLIGGVVVGVQTVTGEDVIDFSISFVLVHAHGAAFFQGGLHIDPAFVFQYVRPCNGWRMMRPLPPLACSMILGGIFGSIGFSFFL